MYHPGLERVLRGSENPGPAATVLDDGQDVHLGAVEQVGGEEVQRQDRLCLGSQELGPARAVRSGECARQPARCPIDGWFPQFRCCGHCERPEGFRRLEVMFPPAGLVMLFWAAAPSLPPAMMSYA
jgi:hypothetical protein